MKTAQQTASSEPIRCPKCFSVDVRYSKRRFWDSVLETLFHWEVFRCRSCRHRFHEYLSDNKD